MINKLELHYFFYENDTSHSMDAVIRNKCEHELLQIISTVSKELGLSIKIETEAYKEGGLKEFYTFIGTAEGQAIMAIGNLAVTLLGIILSRIPLRKTKIDKAEQLLNIEEKKLNIELLKKELATKQIDIPNINIAKVEFIVNTNVKIIKHKSNFYKHLYNYPKVEKISTVEIDENKKPVMEPKTISRSQFPSFILDSDNLDSIKDENASIEIISPVFKFGKYKWRGIYNQIPAPIEFYMKDKDFKEDVLNEGVSFKSGTFIDCILEIERKIDDLGNIYNSSYSVLTVLKKHTDGKTIETKQGKMFRRKKDASNRQIGLFPSDQIGPN